MRAFMHKRIDSWLTRRIPQDNEQRINHRNIFIIPTRFGASFLFFILLLFLLGTNYQNNVIILISYFLVSFFVVTLLHSFFNLSGLKFQAKNSIQGFVDTQLYFPLIITSKKSRFNIRFSFEQSTAWLKKKDKEQVNENNSAEIAVVQLALGESEIQVPYRVYQRGQYSLGRMLIASEYGFGLFRAWTRLDFAQQVTAYPKPITYLWSDTQQSVAGDEVKDKVESYQDSFQPGQDEFNQLRPYQLGESLSRVSWKHVARGQGWFTKQYQQALAGKLQLNFEYLPAGTLEQRLSWLSYAIKDCSNKQIAFSLKLPDQELAYDNSSQHTLQCLTALACY